MHDSSISASKVVTAALWAWVAGLFIGAWVTWAVSDHDVWMMLALTGCASSALAATAHIRSFSLQICALVRVIGGLECADRSEDGNRLHLLR